MQNLSGFAPIYTIYNLICRELDHTHLKNAYVFPGISGHYPYAAKGYTNDAGDLPKSIRCQAGTVNSHSRGVNNHSNAVNCHPGTVNVRPKVVSDYSRGVIGHSNIVNCHPETVNFHPIVVSNHSRGVNSQSNTVNCHPRTVNFRPKVVSDHSNTVNCHPGTVNFHPKTENIHSNTVNGLRGNNIYLKIGLYPAPALKKFPPQLNSHTKVNMPSFKIIHMFHLKTTNYEQTFELQKPDVLGNTECIAKVQNRMGTCSCGSFDGSGIYQTA